jgi:hypothetical protein
MTAIDGAGRLIHEEENRNEVVSGADVLIASIKIH